MTDLRALQADCGAWGVDTFGTPDPDRLVAHLMSEVEEVQQAADGCAHEPDLWGEALAWELADVAILTMRLAHTYGIDLASAIAGKMAVNRQRTWQQDETGMIRHVED